MVPMSPATTTTPSTIAILTGGAGSDPNPASDVVINGIYSKGTAGKTNNGNTISNCNIFYYYNSDISGNSCGINLDDGNTDWTITGNSFYQTTARTGTPFIGTTYGILILPTAATPVSGNNFVITGNYIGGNAASCAGSPWTMTDPNNPEQILRYRS
jgi:hypothetical protein